MITIIESPFSTRQETGASFGWPPAHLPFFFFLLPRLPPVKRGVSSHPLSTLIFNYHLPLTFCYSHDTHALSRVQQAGRQQAGDLGAG